MADPSKTEKATTRRREEFRKKGSVAKSVEINTAVILLGAFLYFKIAGTFMFDQLKVDLTYYFQNMHTVSLGADDLMGLLINVSLKVLLLVLPLMALIVVIVVVSNLLQVGFMLTLEPITPKLSKLNVITGFKNLFSKRSLENLAKSLTKIVVVGYIVYTTIRKDIPVIIDFFNLNIYQSFLILCKLSMDILYKIILAFIVLAGLDYVFQRYSLEVQMRMSKEEIKEEHKRTEGDPVIKGEIRRRQHEMARHRMMSEIPKADVVITNPFHVAVALRYDAKGMKAPQVVAKGLRRIAEQIKVLAREHDIPIVENPPVARALYKSSKVGQDIPADMYSAVAEILTYIFRLSGKTFGIS